MRFTACERADRLAFFIAQSRENQFNILLVGLDPSITNVVQGEERCLAASPLLPRLSAQGLIGCAPGDFEDVAFEFFLAAKHDPSLFSSKRDAPVHRGHEVIEVVHVLNGPQLPRKTPPDARFQPHGDGVNVLADGLAGPVRRKVALFWKFPDHGSPSAAMR